MPYWLSPKAATYGLVFLASLVFGAALLGLFVWRRGTVVARATFDPGIAPFDIEVRKVPVPATQSEHFIIELKRGQYVVTSHRAFWPRHTPEEVTIQWDCIDTFAVRFDDDYVVTCNWSWGQGATWTTRSATTAPVAPGLSPYSFMPQASIPAGCDVAP